MARKEKITVDYFPHYAIQGKTMFTLEHNYGNDGYCVIFKTMEELCLADHHYIDLNDVATLAYIASKCNVSEALYEEIISTLVKIGTFDKELWENFRVICSAKFLENIKDAYRNRKSKYLSINDIKNNLRKKYSLTFQSDVINTEDIKNFEQTDVRNQQSKVKETKEKESKDINTSSSCEIKNQKNDDDDFKKFFSFLQSLNGYEFSEQIDIDLFLKIKRDNPDKDILSAVEVWCIANAGENKIENARTRLLSWVKNYQPLEPKKIRSITKSPEATKKEMDAILSIEPKSPMDDKETALKWLKSLTSSTISLRGMPQRVKEVCEKWNFNEQEFLKEISEKKVKFL
jgi:hypothetical protein